VQTGATVIKSGSNAQSVTLDALQLDRAFLVFGARLDSTVPSVSEVTGQLVSGTSATFRRMSNANSAPDIPIVYHVAEFASGVHVQRGSIVDNAAVNKVTLGTPVDLKRSFPIISYRNTGTLFGLDDHVRAKLTGTSELTLELYEGNASGTVEWQVVSFDGASVQSADVDIAANATQQSVALATTVIPATSWLLLSYQVGSVGTGIADLMLSSHLEANQVVFNRAAAGAALHATYYVVSFENGSKVQSGSSALAAAVDTLPVSLSPAVDPARSIASSAGLYQREGSTSYNSARNPGYASFTLQLSSGTELVASRLASASGVASSLSWNVVQFQ
jgi:hypothetical protein